MGEAVSPRAVRLSRRALERTSRRGLSVRTVTAPTMIASQEARTSSTRSKSASLDSARRGVWSPRYPSSDTLQLSVVYGRSDIRRSARERPVEPRRRADAANPGRDEDGRARQAGDEHHHAVDDRGGDPLRRAETGGGERPGRHALARSPAA